MSPTGFAAISRDSPRGPIRMGAVHQRESPRFGTRGTNRRFLTLRIDFMSDASQPQPTPDPANAAAWDQVSERELDEALARAETLATELSGEVGPADEIGAAAKAPSFDPTAATSQNELDEELKNLDQLLSESASAISSEASTSDAPAPESKNAQAKKKYVVPEFMSDLTRSDEPPAPPAPIQPEPEAASDGSDLLAIPAEFGASSFSKVGVVGTGGLGIVGTPAKTAKNPQNPPGKKSESAAKPAVPSSTPDPGLPRKLLMPAHAACEKGVRVLEAIDRPFARLGSPVRKLAGLLAIAALAASVFLLMKTRW